MTPEEKKEKNRQYQRKYHETHKEEVRLKNKKWRMANPEKVTEYQHNYWIKNKDRIMQKRHEKNPPKEKVEIVRCKDCKFRAEHIKYLKHLYTFNREYDEKCDGYVCTKHNFSSLRDPNWFCADGKREIKMRG